MLRKSGLTIKACLNVRFAVAHNERAPLAQPGYLLPVEHRQGIIVIDGSMSEDDAAELSERRESMLSKQSKSKGGYAMSEAVGVLPNGLSNDEIRQRLIAWRIAFEARTKMRVIHLSAHLDEGAMIDGRPSYNTHFHAIIDRLGYDQENRRPMRLNRQDMSDVQTVTAEALQMHRGTTRKERGGRPGRQHVPHAEWRHQQEAKRHELEEQVAQAASERDIEADLKAQYKAERDRLKASGEATQRDYQRIKQAYDAALLELRTQRLLVKQWQEQAQQEREQRKALTDNARVLLAQQAEQVKVAQEQAQEATKTARDASNESRHRLDTLQAFSELVEAVGALEQTREVFPVLQALGRLALEASRALVELWQTWRGGRPVEHVAVDALYAVNDLDADHGSSVERMAGSRAA